MDQALFLFLSAHHYLKLFYCVVRIERGSTQNRTGRSFDVGHVSRFMWGVLSPTNPLLQHTRLKGDYK